MDYHIAWMDYRQWFIVKEDPDCPGKQEEMNTAVPGRSAAQADAALCSLRRRTAVSKACETRAAAVSKTTVWQPR